MKRVLGYLVVLWSIGVPVAYGVNVSISSLREEVFAQRGFGTAPWTYADGTPVKAQERMRVVAVRATNSYADSARLEEELRRVKTGEATVEVDALGNVVPTGFQPCLGFDVDTFEGVETERTVLPCVEHSTKASVVPLGKAPIEGAVGIGTSTVSLVENGTPVAVPDVMGSTWVFIPPEGNPGDGWWLFLVVEDTRSGQGLIPSASAVARAGSLAAVVMDDCTGEVGKASPVRLLDGASAPVSNGYVSAPKTPMRATALPATVVAESGTAYSEPEQIEALFTPAFSGFAREADGIRLSFAETADGKTQSRLAGEPVPEGLLYSVFTATSLVGPWKTLDAVIGEKGLALDDEKGYTRRQLSDLSGRVLPIFEDKTRFYRVQQSTTSQGE